MERTKPRLCPFALAALALAVAVPAWPQDDEEEPLGIEDSPAAASARDRLERDAESRGAGQAERESRKGMDKLAERAALRAVRAGPDSPLHRNGVPYLEDWEFRAGATKLLLPAYGNWVNLRSKRKVYESFLVYGEPGEYLAAALVDRGFVRRTGSRFLNFYGLVWVPQAEAYKLFAPATFAAVKESVKERIVAQRAEFGLGRDDFESFEDYINFRRGEDASLGSFVHGVLIHASESDDTLVYFATSLSRFETRGAVIEEPMISTVAYALVRGKFLRVAFTRQYLSDEDMQGLLAFTLAFIEDMRRLNDLPEDRRERP